MGGLYAPGEVATYLKEKEAALREYGDSYSLLVDLREAIPPNPEDAQMLQQSHARMKDGLIRQAIVIYSPVVRVRASQLIEAGEIQDRTRIINSAESPNWEELAMDWILFGKEPGSDTRPDHSDVRADKTKARS